LSKSNLINFLLIYFNFFCRISPLPSLSLCEWHTRKRNKRKNRKKEKKEKLRLTNNGKKYLSMARGWRFSKKFSPSCFASLPENYFENTTRPFTNIFCRCTLLLFLYFSPHLNIARSILRL